MTIDRGYRESETVRQKERKAQTDSQDRYRKGVKREAVKEIGSKTG